MNEEKINKFIENVRNEYKSREGLPRHLNIERVDSTDGSFLQIAYRLLMDKNTFEENSNIYPDLSGLGTKISSSEDKYLIDSMLKKIESKEIESVKINDNILDKQIFLEKIDRIGASNNLVIFASIGLKYNTLYKKGIIKYSNELRSMIFEYNDSIKIKVIPIIEPNEEKRIIILDKNAINWKYKKASTEEDLEITVNDYPKDTLKADVIARSIIKLNFINLEKIKEIRII